MSYVEFQDWIRYRNKRGGLNPGRRLEKQIAITNFFLANALISNSSYSIQDFAVYEDDPNDVELTLDEAFNQWG